jgi:DNA damage-binding protein 1
MTMAHSKVVYGTISMLQRLRPRDSPTDLLFVGTDRFQFFTVAWNPETQQLDTLQTIEDAAEKHLRDSQSQDRCLVDPSGKYMAMHLWEGVLTIMRLPTRRGMTLRLELMEQVRLTELFIKASTFLYTETGHPKIAFLYQTDSESQDSKLATYRLTSDDKDAHASKFDPLKDREMSMDIPDSGAALLIPVAYKESKRHNVRHRPAAKAHLGGLIVVGETRILYIDDVTKATVESALTEASIFVAWAEYDSTHFFVSDDYGNLYMLTIFCNEEVVTKMDMTRMGRTSRASALVYLGNEMLFVGSHYGDSQIWKIDFCPSEDQYLQLVQVITNIGPILDFAVMDMGNREGDDQLGNEYSSGQARIVTGSGAYRDGTLRSVRSGVGLDDIGILADIEGVRDLFSLKSHGSQKIDTLLASFLTETRIFRFDDDGEAEEVEAFNGFVLGHQTLLAANVPGARHLQVTTAGVLLVDADSGVAVASWEPPNSQTITSASANDKWLLISVDGKALVTLNILNDLQVTQRKDIDGTEQISCVHVSPNLEDVGVVGFWSSGSISLLDLTTLDDIRSVSLRKGGDSASIPRDIVLAQVIPPGIAGPTLFIAMEDGNVITFSVTPSDLSLSSRKSVVLGIRQARFHLISRSADTYNIFATSEHPSLIYATEGRIVYSAVTAEDATCVSPFDTEAFPDCVALATDSQLKIARIDDERRTHVRPLVMGEMIRRIAYSPSEKVFGLGCIRRELVRGEEVIQGSFKLVDEVIFDKLGKPFLLESVSALELVESVICAELPDSHGNMVDRFIVGTSFQPDPDMDSDSNVRGRILVLGVDSDRSPYLIMSHELKGACRCLGVMDGKIVAGLSKTIVISEYRELSTISGVLVRLASYRPATYPVDLTINGNIIAVADLMKSLSLVEFVPSQDGSEPQLVELARHYQSAWGTAVCHVDGESWLEADAQGNLMILRRNPAGVTLEDRRRMEMTSEMNLGEMVNKIRKISVATSPNALIIPKAFLGTVSSNLLPSS